MMTRGKKVKNNVSFDMADTGNNRKRRRKMKRNVGVDMTTDTFG